MTAKHLKRPLVWLLLFLGICSQNVSAEIRVLVLVTANQDIKPMPIVEVRKLFMGVPVIVDNQQIIPSINMANDIAHEVFLQKIVFMSAQKYKRQLLSRVFRYGGKRPKFYSNSDSLIRSLQAKSNNVSYMWARDVEENHELFIVQELWMGNIE